jgi:hypothetical protein
MRIVSKRVELIPEKTVKKYRGHMLNAWVSRVGMIHHVSLRLLYDPSCFPASFDLYQGMVEPNIFSVHIAYSQL